MVKRWYTVLTVVVLLFCIGTLVNAIYYDFSILSVIGIVLIGVMSYWVLVGCARRGEPLARWILHRSP